jgi:hypothetical protein
MAYRMGLGELHNFKNKILLVQCKARPSTIGHRPNLSAGGWQCKTNERNGDIFARATSTILEFSSEIYFSKTQNSETGYKN